MAAPREVQVRQCFVVHREEAHGRAVFGSHVGDGRAVRHAQAGKAGAVELHKFSDHALLAQHFRDGKNQVRCRRSLAQPSVQLEAHHFRHQHGQRLPEHGSLRFNPADAPAKHAERVHHCRVRVRAHQRIGIRFETIAIRSRANHARQVLDVHLMADSGVRRHHLEIAERVLSPAQELVALDIALKFKLGVHAESIHVAEAIHLHGVVDDQFGGEERIDALCVAAQFLHGFAHGGQIHNGRDAGEVLQQHARRHKRSFFLRRAWLPIRQGADILGMHETAVFHAQKIFEQNSQGEGKIAKRTEPLLFQLFEAMDFERLGPDAQ